MWPVMCHMYSVKYKYVEICNQVHTKATTDAFHTILQCTLHAHLYMSTKSQHILHTYLKRIHGNDNIPNPGVRFHTLMPRFKIVHNCRLMERR